MKNICITIHHEGTFAYNPLSYEYGDVDVVENVNLGNCNYERLMKIVKECCLFPVHDMYFCAPKVDIGKHLKSLRNDSELANFVKLAYDNGCKVELYVEHHGYDVMADGELEIEVVDEELDDEIEMEDVSEYVGLDYVGEEDVEIPNTRLNDTFLNKLVDGKFISDKDFRAKVDTQSSSSRNVDDSSVDDRFEVKEGFSYLVYNPKLPWNEMAPLLGMKFEHPDQLKDFTCKWIAKQFAAEVLKNPKISYRQMMVADVREKFFINDYKDEILSTNPGSSVQLDVDTMDDGETQFKRMYIYLKGVLLNLHFSPCLMELNIKIVHLSFIVTITDLRIKKVVESALAA
ncbi:hypothetical protein Tco_1309769 [Tanacetum coccineum]